MIDTQLFQEYSPELYDLAKQIAESYRDELKRNNIVASGDLVHFRWDIELESDGLRLVFYLPHYWRYPEFGRRETKNGGNGAVVRAIRQWIEDKGITPTARTGKNGRKYIPTKNQLAFLIARKIHAVGYYGNSHYGKNPLETALNQSNGLFSKFTATASKIITGQIEQEILKIGLPDVEAKL